MIVPLIAAAGRTVAATARAGAKRKASQIASARQSNTSAIRTAAQRRSENLLFNNHRSSQFESDQESQLQINRTPFRPEYLSQNQSDEQGTTEAQEDQSEFDQDITDNDNGNEQNYNESQIESEIGASRSQSKQSKTSPSSQLANVAEDLVKKKIKQQLIIWALPAAGTIAFWTLIAFIFGLMIFAVASVYMCAEKKGIIGTLWTTSLGTDFTELLAESFSGTCLAETTSAPKSTGSPTESSPPSSIPINESDR